MSQPNTNNPPTGYVAQVEELEAVRSKLADIRTAIICEPKLDHAEALIFQMLGLISQIQHELKRNNPVPTAEELGWGK